MMCDKCKDCANLSARDVFNGVCIISKETVSIDAPVCEKFLRANKCKYCSKYIVSEKVPNLGTCDGDMVYPDLGGCEDFTPAE